MINLILSYLTFTSPQAFGWITSPLTYFVLVTGIGFTITYPRYLLKKHLTVSGQRGT